MANDLANPTAAASDLPQTLAFLRDAFDQWRQQGRIRAEEAAALDAYYDSLSRDAASGKPPSALLTLPSPDLCWSCKGPVGAAPYCFDCGAPVHTDAVDRLRRLICICHEIKRHERDGRLDLAAVHGCLADANSRIAALRRRLDGQRLAAGPARSDPVLTAEIVSPPRPPAPRRNFLEILLDPRSIQWLLASGGAVLVIGLIIWLAASRFFENPVVVAVLLGVVNGLLLAGGVALVRFTRYQIAGRALTLLACLVMPLNLWFYDYQGLITIEKGDHLWVAALLCCVLYAAAAAVIRDPMIVYVFVGGVVLTGLLLLADHLVSHFWEAAAPATFLVIVGLIGVHLFRVFSEGDGPFTRDKFGLAFFWSGQAALGAGLLLVLIAQLAGGVFYESLFKPVYNVLDVAFGYPVVQAQSYLASSLNGRILALVLVAAATYAYLYSDLVVRKVGVYIHLAIGTFLWAEVLALTLIFYPNLPRIEVVIMVLALTGLLANVALTRIDLPGSYLRRTGPPLALTLSLLPLLLGLMLHLRAVAFVDIAPWHYTLGWWYVAAMAVTAVASRAGAWLYRGAQPWLVAVYLFSGGGALMLMASGVVLSYQPALQWVFVAPLLMPIPLAFLIAGRLYRGRPMETPIIWAAHAMTLVLIVCCLACTYQDFVMQTNVPQNLPQATLFGLAALFYLLAAVWRDRVFAVYACAASATAAIWQLLSYADLRPEYYIGAFAVLGLLGLIGYRFALLGPGMKAGLGRAAFQSGNALLTLAAGAAILLGLSSMAGRSFQLGLLVAMLAVVAAASLAAVFLVRSPGWRRWYVLAAVANAALMVLVLVWQLDWTPWQKLEVACVGLGAALLVASHLGWFREHEREEDTVSFGLFVGCLLVAVPLTWSVLYCRTSLPREQQFNTFHTLNEVGMLATGLVLLASGFVLRIKSTTLTGAAVMALYLLSLAAFIRLPEMLQTTAVYLMIGGGLFFLVGLLLSIYRDRLLALPDRIKRREGVFRVLNWR